MNWTGGRLQRHSHRNQDSTLQRQKQHFAKVRTRLQHTRQSQSLLFQPSFLRHDASTLADNGMLARHDSHRDVGHAKSRQATLEEFDSTKPLAMRLSTLRNYSSQRLSGDAKQSGHAASQMRYLSPLQTDEQLYEAPPRRRLPPLEL